MSMEILVNYIQSTQFNFMTCTGTCRIYVSVLTACLATYSTNNLPLTVSSNAPGASGHATSIDCVLTFNQGATDAVTLDFTSFEMESDNDEDVACEHDALEVGGS